MKTFAFALFSCGLLFAQPPQPVQVAPGTPAVKPPQTAAPAAAEPIKPDTIVMEADGKKYTAAEVDQMIALLPQQAQQTARSQPQLLSQVLMMKKLAEDAVANGRDKQSPYKELLESARLQILANAELTMHANMQQINVADQEKYYKDHPEKFQTARVRVIYIQFNPAPDKIAADGKKLPSEAEAKAKIEELRKQIVAGADFGKLARENSNDSISAGKDGDFGTIKHSSSYPDAIKNAVFALKAGEMSQAIKLANGFYLIRVDALDTEPYSDATAQIADDLRRDLFTEWTNALQKQFAVKVDNPGYFTPKAPAQLQQVH